MDNLNALKYCFACKRPKPKETFRTLPSNAGVRAVCTQCYEELAGLGGVMRNAEDAEDIRRAVYDGMRDLRNAE